MKTDRERRGLLIRESLVTVSFEMTADLHKSIIRLRYATALLPPVPLSGGCLLSKKQYSSAGEGELRMGRGLGKFSVNIDETIGEALQ